MPFPNDNGNPYARIRHHEVLGSNGRSYPCRIVWTCINDLYRHQLLTRDDHDRQISALQDHMYRGTLPGDTRFYSVYSGEHVYWVELVDDLMEMYTMAVNFWDLTDSDEENHEPMIDHDVPRDLYAVPFPTNIGAFRLHMQAMMAMDIEEDGIDTDETLNTTQSTAESTTEN